MLPHAPCIRDAARLFPKLERFAPMKFVGSKQTSQVESYVCFLSSFQVLPLRESCKQYNGTPMPNDYMLQETFRAHFSSVKGVKFGIDRLTGRTKGHGFVRFGDESGHNRATEMNGVPCPTNPMRLRPSTNKKIITIQQYPKVISRNSERG